MDKKYKCEKKLIGSYQLIWTIDQQHICLVASGGHEPMTFRSQSPMLSHYTTHFDKDNCLLTDLPSNSWH